MHNTDPIALNAEKALLSDIIRHPNIMSDVQNKLSSDDFAEPSHSIIFDSITDIVNRGQKLGFVVLAEHLRNKDNLTKIGGDTYLLDILNADAPHNIGSSADEAALVIQRASRKRKLAELARRITADTMPGSDTDPNDVLLDTEKRLFDLSRSVETSQEQSTVAEMLASSVEEIFERGEAKEGSVFGVPSGLPSLDKMTTGFHPGQFILIAARPGMGKSTLAVDFARHASFRSGKTVMFFSLEMDRKEIMQRIIAAETKIELEHIKKGTLAAADWERIREAASKMLNSNFIVDDSPNLTISQIRSRALRQLNSEAGLDMIVLDYLQLMRSPGKVESRQQEVSDFSRSLKLLSKELGVPVISLSQLNRSSENRADKRPMISDLRESGSLEQDADMVFLIHRPEVLDENDHPGQAELIIAKHRGGPTGVINIMPLLIYSKFVEQAIYLPSEGESKQPRDEDAPPPDEPPVQDDTNVPYDPYTGEVPASYEEPADPFGPPSEDENALPAW